MRANLSRQIINKPVAAALVFWLSGLMFLFCCEMPTAQAAEAESCPLAKINHCAKQNSGESLSQIATVWANGATLDCCRFIPSVFDKAQKIEPKQQTEAAAPVRQIARPEFSSVKADVDAAGFYQPRVLNLSGTYLVNRVFRI